MMKRSMQRLPHRTLFLMSGRVRLVCRVNAMVVWYQAVQNAAKREREHQRKHNHHRKSRECSARHVYSIHNEDLSLSPTYAALNKGSGRKDRPASKRYERARALF